MKLRYETGTATLIHFIVMMLFSFVNALLAIIDGCKDTDVINCIQSTGISLIFVLLLAGWFGFLAALGYAAQDKRSHKLARLLMGAEAMVLLVALFNVRHFNHHSNTPVELITSLADAAFAAWIIILAFRLSRAKGGRITAARTLSGRPRRRPTPSTDAK